ASIKPATLAHPIIKTRAAAPKSIQSIVATFATSWSLSGVNVPGEFGFASSIPACALAYCLLNTLSSAPACSRLTSGSNRPNRLKTGLFKSAAGGKGPEDTIGGVSHTSTPGTGKPKPDGRTATTVSGVASSVIVLPTTAGSPLNRRRHSSPLMITTDE